MTICAFDTNTVTHHTMPLAVGTLRANNMVIANNPLLTMNAHKNDTIHFVRYRFKSK